MKYTHVFFDLDGTLIDSSEGITRSVQYALEHMGYDVPPKQELLGFIGPPLLWGFSELCGMDREQALRAIALYRERYSKIGALECSLYDGIEHLLRRLCDAGFVCVLATCKPHLFATRILAHLGIADCFAFVSGPEMDGTRGEKPEVIEHATKTLGIADPSRVLMVGDRDSDVRGAAQHGIDGAGVLWGFGSQEELADAGATYLCRTPEELLAIVCRS